MVTKEISIKSFLIVLLLLTGIVFSGKSRAQNIRLDKLVFDIQDIGC